MGWDDSRGYYEKTLASLDKKYLSNTYVADICVSDTSPLSPLSASWMIKLDD